MREPHPLRDWRNRTGTFCGREGDIVSQEQLASQVAVVPSHLSQIETGDRLPSLSLASKLSSITGIPIGEFVRVEKADGARGVSKVSSSERRA